MHRSRSAKAATRRVPARSPSRTESRRSSGSRSVRLSPSTAVAEPSSASSRTHVSSATSSPSSHPRPPEHRTPSRSWSTPTRRRSARSGERRATGPLQSGPGFGAATSRHPSWRCSPWPPSSCCWLRSLPQQASPSSRSDGSASSACSLRSARPKAPSTRAAHERRGRRRGRRTDRNDRGSRTLGRGRADTRARARLSPRPARPPLGTARHDRRRRGPLCDSRRLVAGASGRACPSDARTLGATARAEACTPLGNSRGRADRGGNRQPRVLEPRQNAAHRGRDRGDDPRHAAPRSAGDSPLRPGGRARPDRRSLGAARPRPLPSSFRGGTRGDHTCPRHRRDYRHHRGGRREEVSRRTAQPVHPADPRVHRCNAGPGHRRDPDAGPARTNGCSRPPARGGSR